MLPLDGGDMPLLHTRIRRKLYTDETSFDTKRTRKRKKRGVECHYLSFFFENNLKNMSKVIEKQLIL